MKFLFLKILLLIFIFGSGMNLIPSKEKHKNLKLARTQIIVNFIVAILMGIAVCMLP